VVALREVSGHLNRQLGFYGAVENRIAEAVADASKIGLRLKTTLSELEDADVTAAILELNSVELNQRAALSSRALINRSSLFDYLK
jgi:flagellin-like hook-associated protein FlgL